MKKILKCIAAGFAICFGLFALTACGNSGKTGQFSKASVNTSGKYSVCNATDTAVATEIGDFEEQNQNFNYKMTLKFTAKGLSFNCTMLTKVSEGGAVEALAGKLKLSAQGVSMNAEVYAPNDGYLYTNLKIKIMGRSETDKSKTQLNSTDLMGEVMGELPYGMGTMMGSDNLDIVGGFLSTYNTEGVILKKATKGTQTKYNLLIKGGTDETFGAYDTNMWLVINEDGSFAGAKIKGKLGAETIGYISSMKYSVDIVPFDGEIEMPEDLDSYGEVED